MNQIVNEFLFKLDVIAPFLAIVYLFINHARSFSNRTLFAFVMVQFSLNVLSAFLQDKQINNLWVYHLNCVATHILFSIYFVRVFRTKWLVGCGLFLFGLCYVFLVYRIQPRTVFPSYSYALSSFVLVIYALILLNKVINEIPTFHILSLKEFWLISGVLTYFGSAFLIFISYHYLSEVAPKQVYILWQVHNVFLGLSCAVFIKATTCKQWMRE